MCHPPIYTAGRQQYTIGEIAIISRAEIRVGHQSTHIHEPYCSCVQVDLCDTGRIEVARGLGIP